MQIGLQHWGRWFWRDNLENFVWEFHCMKWPWSWRNSTHCRMEGDSSLMLRLMAAGGRKGQRRGLRGRADPSGSWWRKTQEWVRSRDLGEEMCLMDFFWWNAVWSVTPCLHPFDAPGKLQVTIWLVHWIFFLKEGEGPYFGARLTRVQTVNVFSCRW